MRGILVERNYLPCTLHNKYLINHPKTKSKNAPFPLPLSQTQPMKLLLRILLLFLLLGGGFTTVLAQTFSDTLGVPGSLHHPRQIFDIHPNIGKIQIFNIMSQSRQQRRLCDCWVIK